MASSTDTMSCNCATGKTVTSYCKRHLQSLCMDCLLSEHKECIRDIITIEEATRNTHTFWDEILSECESYKLLYEKQKSKKEDLYQKMDAIDKEFRTTISKMRLEMIKRINLICKNALELSVSVMSHRVSVSKSDIEMLDNTLDKLKSLQSLAEKRNQLNENKGESIADLEKAHQELAVVETTFKELKDTKKEVLIQFVVPPIVSDFMAHFNSLGEIVEEVKEDGRTSVYVSDKERVDIRSRAQVELSRNPFKALRSNVDCQNTTDEEKDNSDELFIFQKGIYNQDDRNLYAYIDVQNSGEVTVSETMSSSSMKTLSNIPPLPVKPTPCRSSNAPGYECPDVFPTSNPAARIELHDNHVLSDERVEKPVPRPRLSIGKDASLKETNHQPQSRYGNKTEEIIKGDELCNLRPIILKNSGRLSTSSDESNTSSRTAKTDSGIIDDKPRSYSPSPTNVPQSLMPAQVRNEMFRFFPGPELRNSDPALNTKESKQLVPPALPFNLSKSTGRIRFPSGDKRVAALNNNTYPNYTAARHVPKSDDHDAESDTDPASIIGELDSIIKGQDDHEEGISAGSAASLNRSYTTQMPTAALSVIELQSHQKDTKDVCIITSIVVTEKQLMVVCDYSHNCIQVYDNVGNRIQVYGLAKPFGLCLLRGNKIAITSRNRSSVNIFNLEEGMLQFEKEHRLGNLVNVFGLSCSNGFICVCCLTNLVLFTEDLRPYSSVKAINGMESKGTLKRKKFTKPVFSNVKYCAIDFNEHHKSIFVSDFKQDRIVHINDDGEVHWVLSVKAPKSIALHQGKLYVAAKKQIVIVDVVKGAIQREVREGVPKYPWALFVDDTTSTMFITNGSINDAESRKIHSLPIKILTMILG